LLVDKATFPSDTLSTHLIHPPGVAALRRWGLLDRLTATGCPPIHTYAFDFGDLTLAGSPAFDGAPVAYGPGELSWTSCSSMQQGRREPKSARVSAPTPCSLPMAGLSGSVAAMDAVERS
jgi:hypothetical protein